MPARDRAVSLRSVYVPLSSSILGPVADVISRRVVVPPVYLPHPGTVKVQRDSSLLSRVTYSVNAPLIRQHSRDPIFPSPLKLPELLQARIVEQGTVVDTLVALFQDASRDATKRSPGGMVVDASSRTRRPNEDLQRVGAARALLMIGYVPVLILSRILQERQDVRAHKVGIPRQLGQNGNGLPQGQFLRNVGVGCV